MKRIESPCCKGSEIVKDFRVSQYPVVDDNGKIWYEETPYEPDEMDGEYYCEGCTRFIFADEFWQLVESLKKENNNG